MRMNDQEKNAKYFRGLVSVAAMLLLWEMVARLGLIREIFISKPSSVISSGVELIASGKIWFHLLISLETFLLGFLAALVVGIFLGILIGYKRNIYDYLYVHVLILSALPFVAILPLIIIWFGVGISSKIFIVFLMALVPILLSSIEGSRNADEQLLVMAKSFGAGDFWIIKTVVFYDALPFIFNGIKIAINRGVIGLVIAEVFGYGNGLGFLIASYAASFQTPKVFFVLTILLSINLLATYGVNRLEKRIIFWR